ncbi:MAG: hypothetical protein AAFU85_04675 [Planctomycetota bacterium]
MTELPPTAGQLADQVRETLWRDWDPIGVNEYPEARDEYDSYVSGVCSLLLDGADARKLRKHLEQIETVTMGLSFPCPQLDTVVQKLLSMVGRSPEPPNQSNSLVAEPFESPTEATSALDPAQVVRARHRTVFVFVLTLALTLGLFVPTVELFKGKMSLGRAPVWLAYLGLLMPEFRVQSVAVVLAHFLASLVIAWSGCRLPGIIGSRRS